MEGPRTDFRDRFRGALLGLAGGQRGALPPQRDLRADLQHEPGFRALRAGRPVAPRVRPQRGGQAPHRRLRRRGGREEGAGVSAAAAAKAGAAKAEERIAKVLARAGLECRVYGMRRGITEEQRELVL